MFGGNGTFPGSGGAAEGSLDERADSVYGVNGREKKKMHQKHNTWAFAWGKSK